MTSPTRKEITIALIGFAGVVLTALLSNYDKIFTGTTTQSNYNSEVVNGDINIQLRQLIETSGMRASLEAIEKNRLEQYKAKYKASQEELNCIADVGLQNNQLIDILVEALRKNLSLKDIQELNKFYTSSAMVNYISKQPAITLDMIHGLEEAMARNHRRNIALAGTNRDPKKQTAQSCPTTEN
ncbi:DUF2059 domain-containing protein [Pseudomonas sp. yb_2]|uniref:DUF2059 domain-containing protein n=1 Tax=Pseudomonas sp. yb_2 TaxID=3367218 RepID=UPI00370A8BAF